MKVSVFIGVSVDGFIARRNGDLDFLTSGGGEPHGYDEFMASVDTHTAASHCHATVSERACKDGRRNTTLFDVGVTETT